MAESTIPLPASVTLVTGRGELSAVQVRTPRCTGEVYLHGATVTEWTPTGAQPVIFVSEHSHWSGQEPIRGGIPLCGPWFGPGRNGGMDPIHGFFRLTEWTLTNATDDDGTVRLSFALDGAKGGWPMDYPTGFTASYDVVMGDALELTLSVTATGEADVDLEEAVHTYFRVGDITTATVEGLDGARYADKAPGGRAVNAQQGSLRFLRETDRVYAFEGDVSLVDPTLGRTIHIAKTGSGSTVVWNPWSAKAAALADFGDDEWTSMVCIETANALRSSVTVPAGQTHTMSTTYTVSPD